MSEKQRSYIAIDLKSFYASVECVERSLNPLDACLVVADESRTDKTICLAVSPALKAYGIPGRPRLFEVRQKVREANRQRHIDRRSGRQSFLATELNACQDMAIDFIIARPRMKLYLDYSAKIYGIYLKHIASEDIHVYSIDEVFMDVTDYLDTYGLTPRELAMRIIRDVLGETGITATAGIGSNLYLCKIAMDIVAKKMQPDKDGVRIAELDETEYRRQLWEHMPLTDFWRVGAGIARRLSAAGIHTMGDLARMSITNEDWLYHEFGVNAELLIDHAWGWEPVTMAQVKAYRPLSHSISSGQVLQNPYTYEAALTVVREMADEVSLELLEKGLETDQIVLTIGYDIENLTDPAIRNNYDGRISIDRYGRQVPYHAHGTENLTRHTSSSRLLIKTTEELFERIVRKELLIRRITLCANRLRREQEPKYETEPIQFDLFSDPAEQERCLKAEAEANARERRRQMAILELRKRFGKNAVLKGINYAEGATQRERHCQIGGHKA